LLGSLLARKRPKSRTYPTREDDVDDAQRKIKIRRKSILYRFKINILDLEIIKEQRIENQ
jgi:hypothetical protein